MGDFDRAMLDIYNRARAEIDYKPTRFFQMLDELGGLETARTLLASPGVSDGFTTLWEAQRLDLAVEALVLRDEWRQLFTEEELRTARKRLESYGVDVDSLNPPVTPLDAGLDVLVTPPFRSLIELLNERAGSFQIGQLQVLRKQLRGLDRIPTQLIFTDQSIHEGDSPYAFHLGGRKELQFNVGLEEREGVSVVRHGVAFSIETSQALPDPVGTLAPKVRRFNEFLTVHTDRYADLRAWHWRGGSKSSDGPVATIPPAQVEEGTFIFLGSWQSLSEVSVTRILSDFDRLLPLYMFVEGDASFPETVGDDSRTSQFRPGHHPRVIAPGLITRAEREIQVTYRHNEMQSQLFDRLVHEFGEDHVATEHRTPLDMFVDVAVSTEEGLVFYEIKPYTSARLCIREALSQLLEYCYWPGSEEAVTLVVVGREEPNHDVAEYVTLLRNRFSLPVYYESVSGSRV